VRPAYTSLRLEFYVSRLLYKGLAITVKGDLAPAENLGFACAPYENAFKIVRRTVASVSVQNFYAGNSTAIRPSTPGSCKHHCLFLCHRH
jgi:hypothetical protein